MPLTITEYRCKLINLILFARSEKHVERLIHASIKGLKECHLNGHLIVRFVEKTAKDLESFTPVNHNSRQWANILMARIQVNQLKDAIRGNAPSGKTDEVAVVSTSG